MKKETKEKIIKILNKPAKIKPTKNTGNLLKKLEEDSKKADEWYADQILELFEQEKQKWAKEIRNDFISEFCNDHNADKDGNGIRWLRSIAFDEEDLLEQILEFFKQKLKKVGADNKI